MFDFEFPFVRMLWLGQLVGVGNRKMGRDGDGTSIWSLVQESMDMDLTLEMWVPNFRCNEAHRMQRKIPSCGERHKH